MERRQTERYQVSVAALLQDKAGRVHPVFIAQSSRDGLFVQTDTDCLTPDDCVEIEFVAHLGTGARLIALRAVVLRREDNGVALRLMYRRESRYSTGHRFRGIRLSGRRQAGAAALTRRSWMMGLGTAARARGTHA